MPWEDFLLGGGNLMRSDFDRSENCYLVGGNEPLVCVYVEGGGDKQVFS